MDPFWRSSETTDLNSIPFRCQKSTGFTVVLFVNGLKSAYKDFVSVDLSFRNLVVGLLPEPEHEIAILGEFFSSTSGNRWVRSDNWLSPDPQPVHKRYGVTAVCVIMEEGTESEEQLPRGSDSDELLPA